MADTRLIHGRYRLLEVIGRGGMGEVWRATDESLGRRVAVKCLKPLGPQHDPGSVRVLRERFRREARVAASLQHRGVTVVHDFGESDGTPFLVMEHLEGRNLSQLLEDNKHHPLPVDDVVDIAEQVADALAYTHRQGIVHRDLKPANIMRLADGTVKICDFGIARLDAGPGHSSRLTSGEITLGTPHYMSPEQIGGGRVDHRSDLYSLGCVLYEISTGVPPFDQDDAWGILVGHRDTPPEPPRTHRAELPAPFERIVLDLLAKTPDARPADAGDVRRRISGARGAVPAGATALPTAPPHPATPPHGAPVPPAAPPGPDTGAQARAARRTDPPPSAVPAPRAPAWTRTMTTGRKAVGTHHPGPVPPPHDDDPATTLTGTWTTGAGTSHRGTGAGAGTGARTGTGGTGPGALGTGGGPWRPRAAAPDAPGAETDSGTHRFTLPPPPGRPPRGSEPQAALADRHGAALRLARLGRWAEAGEAHRAVAAERERVLGADHPDTLASRHERGVALSRAGRVAAALRELDRVAEARDRVLGPDHPDTVATRQESAYVLTRLGRHADAHRVHAAVLAARARVLGAGHPDTVAALQEVAHALGRLGRWEEALRTCREVADARARARGADHPDTLAARYEVGIALGRLDRGHEALELYRDLTAARSRAQGPEHPETLRARHGLGVNLGRLGRWEEALREARDVAATRARVLGPDHPDTLVSGREVAVCLGWLGRWGEALTGYRHVSEARERVIGPDHPDTLASRNDEAQCLEQLGRHTEAVELHRRVAAAHRRRTPG
ncbi:serine/threonine-protein kinase [Streptomyces kanasensis]|uniref:serine/threonine-protein kinase n=1 Tax=Streptomyces kanasensis TaxID=936756 RepID=UPI003800DB03